MYYNTWPLTPAALFASLLQEPVLFSCSIRENIAYGATDPDAVTTEDVYRAAKVANAYDFIQTFPKGFDTVVGEKGVLLSGEEPNQLFMSRHYRKCYLWDLNGNYFFICPIP